MANDHKRRDVCIQGHPAPVAERIVLVALVAEDAVEVADPDAVAELPEPIGMFVGAVMKVFGLGDQCQVLPAANAEITQSLTERLQCGSIHMEQFMLVELNFDRSTSTEHRNPGAAIIEEQVFELVEIALQHGPVDVVPPQVAVPIGFGPVARLQHDMDHFAERLQQREERIEQPFRRHGRGECRQSETVATVAEDLDSVAFPWSNRHTQRGTNGICQGEVPIPLDSQMIGKRVGVHANSSRPSGTSVKRAGGGVAGCGSGSPERFNCTRRLDHTAAESPYSTPHSPEAVTLFRNLPNVAVESKGWGG